MTSWRRAVGYTVGLFIAVNVVLTLVAWLDKLPDLPHTHATTNRIGLGTVLWGNGSIISPPFVFMVVVALLLCGAVTTRTWLSRISAALLVAGMVAMAIDEYMGDGGLKTKPALYGQAKWDLAMALGWVFIAAAAAVVVTGAGLLGTSLRNAPATA
jgi:hypothetical protein